MTRDDIIRMAREAGIKTFPEWAHGVPVENLERLLAAEREACAISCEVNAARWIDAGGKQWYAAHECAAAIRARSQQ